MFAGGGLCGRQFKRDESTLTCIEVLSVGGVASQMQSVSAVASCCLLARYKPHFTASSSGDEQLP
jgi:hypothetical protein